MGNWGVFFVNIFYGSLLFFCSQVKNPGLFFSSPFMDGGNGSGVRLREFPG
jgi:hypothetical protein